MAKKEVQYDERGAAPCKACKRKGKIAYPKIVEITGEELYYAQCPCCNNRSWDIYEFLGATVKGAINTWNNTMLNKNSF